MNLARQHQFGQTILVGTLVVAAMWAGPIRAADDDLLDAPSLSLQGQTASAPPASTNLPSPAKIDPSLLPDLGPRPAPEPSVSGGRAGMLSIPAPVPIGGLPPTTNPAPAAAQETTPATVTAPPPNGLLLRIEPVKPPPAVGEADLDDDEETPRRSSAPPPATMGPTAQRPTQVGTPERGSLLDRIISGRTRSYALTNVAANTTNSVFRPLYNTEPDLRDYHPTERPEHVPAQENSNREVVQ